MMTRYLITEYRIRSLLPSIAWSQKRSYFCYARTGVDFPITILTFNTWHMHVRTACILPEALLRPQRTDLSFVSGRIQQIHIRI